ncbi:MAG: hypothetical protein ACTSVY_10965 [Candidatus Helarchaeota archaeon]
MENVIRATLGNEDEVVIVDDVATSIDVKKFEMFKKKEFLEEFFGESSIVKMWGYPFLTDASFGLLFFAENRNRNLVYYNWKMDISFIQDIKFIPKRRTILIKYNIPKASKGIMGRGGHKGALEFTSMKFPTWQSELSKLVLGRQKDKLEEKLENLLPEYEEVKAQLDNLQSKFLSGEITEEMHDKFAKDFKKRLKNLEKQKMIIEKELKSLKI